MNSTNNYFPKAAFLVAGLIGLLALGACSTAPPTEQGKTDLRKSSADALTQAQQDDPSMQKLIQNSPGYVVFPSVGKGAIGRGSLRKADQEGKCRCG